jgi:DNA primase
MNLLELAEEQGLQSHRTSASQGGEYHCPCPRCGGKDRFMLWPAVNRYWCRQCKARGDAIQFCRDFQNPSFQDALIKTQTNLPNLDFRPSTLPIRLPFCQWEEKAKIFTSSSHLRLISDKTAIESIGHRGLSIDTIKNNQLGWNPVNPSSPNVVLDFQ